MEQNNPTLEQDENRNPNGRFKVGNNANPTGKGGLQERPEDINIGGRPKNAESFAYWYRFFKNINEEEYKQWLIDNPEEKRTFACRLSMERFKKAGDDLKEFQEIADRSEGRAVQTMKHEGDLITGIKVEIVDGTNSESNESI